MLRGDFTGDNRVTLLGEQPHYIQIQQSRRRQKCLVRISTSRNEGTLPYGLAIEHRQAEHSANRKGRTFRRIQRPGCAKQGGCILLTALDDTLGIVKHIGTGNLSNIQMLHPEHAVPLVAGHVQTKLVCLRVSRYKITDGGIHISQPTSWRLPA